MNQISEVIGGVIVVFAIAFFISVLGGTFLWFIWEDSITAMFPKAVESGVLAASLGWWQSVKIVWVFSLLIKATQTNNKKD